MGACGWSKSMRTTCCDFARRRIFWMRSPLDPKRRSQGTPIASMLFATFAAAPSRRSVRATWTTATGASGEMREMPPNQYRSDIESPQTSTLDKVDVLLVVEAPQVAVRLVHTAVHAAF